MRILAGDIGGTHTRLQLLATNAAGASLVREVRYASRDYDSLAKALQEFLAGDLQTVSAACLGIAGPVRTTATGQAVRTTNLPWEIDSRAIAREFHFGSLRLINDFQAVGYGIETLGLSALKTLQAGEPMAVGPRAVIGAGTGLGQGILVWQGDHYEAVGTEGGHVDFAPTSELEVELTRQLWKELGRASYEDILSGPGLVRIYRFLLARGGREEDPALAQAMRAGDPAAAITEFATRHHDALAASTLDLFVTIYGAQAGNLALSAGATGGLYIAGGIAPRIMARLQEGAFLRAFRDKGSMAGFVSRVPVHVVLDTDVGLRGASQVALRLAAGSP